MRRAALIAALAATVSTALLPTGALAQSAFPAPGDDAVLTLGGGPKLQPKYEGAKNYMFAPFPIISLRFMVNPFTGQPSSEFGFGVAPAFRFLDERSGSVDRRLRGTDKIGIAVETGLTVDYTTPFARGFVEVRQGFGGHSGQVADLGLDGILRPAPGVKLSLGPRISFASADYMDTYFTIDRKAAARSRFNRFEADAGLKSWGAGGRIDWDLTPQWLIRLDGTWNRMAGDAGRSPIVRNGGDRDQFTVGLGAAYRFGLDYK
jgi:outer membrane protein